jgi:hypothetical protein
VISIGNPTRHDDRPQPSPGIHCAEHDQALPYRGLPDPRSPQLEDQVLDRLRSFQTPGVCQKGGPQVR